MFETTTYIWWCRDIKVSNNLYHVLQSSMNPNTLRRLPVVKHTAKCHAMSWVPRWVQWNCDVPPYSPKEVPCHGSLGWLVLQAPLENVDNNKQLETCFRSSVAKGNGWDLEENCSGSIYRETHNIRKSNSERFWKKWLTVGAKRGPFLQQLRGHPPTPFVEDFRVPFFHQQTCEGIWYTMYLKWG